MIVNEVKIMEFTISLIVAVIRLATDISREIREWYRIKTQNCDNGGDKPPHLLIQSHLYTM